MVAENLGDSTVFLKHFTAFAGFLRETVEKVECGSVGIHRG
jgi:hypothetical protein